MKLHQDDRGDWVCEHGTAVDVHCCNCHSGFLFDSDSCVCGIEDNDDETSGGGAGSLRRALVARVRLWIDRFRALGGVPELCDLSWQLCNENESLVQQLREAHTQIAQLREQLKEAKELYEANHG